EMRPRTRLVTTLDTADEDSALRALLQSDDVRDVRLALDLLPPIPSPSDEAVLQDAVAHADPEVRIRALAQLAATGDTRAAEQKRDLVVALLDDPDRAVRRAALEAVAVEDAGHPEVTTRVVAALDDPQTAGSAASVLQRLGDAAVPLIAAAVARP